MRKAPSLTELTATKKVSAACDLTFWKARRDNMKISNPAQPGRVSAHPGLEAAIMNTTEVPACKITSPTCTGFEARNIGGHRSGSLLGMRARLLCRRTPDRREKVDWSLHSQLRDFASAYSAIWNFANLGGCSRGKALAGPLGGGDVVSSSSPRFIEGVCTDGGAAISSWWIRFSLCLVTFKRGRQLTGWWRISFSRTYRAGEHR